MAEPREPVPSLLVVACFSGQGEALAWAEDRLVRSFGPVALSSPLFDFHHTRYYEQTMGAQLKKRFLAFERLVPPDFLADAKIATNALERELAGAGRFAQTRPLNLDPGLLQLGKFLLATTKDQAHRVYLRDGIYAEVTLRYQDGNFEPWPWTYADYREAALKEFLNSARDFYRQRLAAPTV